MNRTIWIEPYSDWMWNIVHKDRHLIGSICKPDPGEWYVAIQRATSLTAEDIRILFDKLAELRAGK
jgi:hypothetical protein